MDVLVCFDWVLRVAVIGTVEELEDVAKDLRTVASVDLFDDEELRLDCYCFGRVGSLLTAIKDNCFELLPCLFKIRY